MESDFDHLKKNFLITGTAQQERGSPQSCPEEMSFRNVREAVCTPEPRCALGIQDGPDLCC